MIENVAKMEFRKNRNPMEVILYYIALNKKNILLGLLKIDDKYKRVLEFLARDFSDERAKVAA